MATVLVVDDDPRIRDLLRLYLERERHRVLVAEDGPAALQTIGAAKPDLVLLDVMLPGIDGVEVLRRVRETSEVPVMLLTARSGDGDKVIGLDGGADDYVVKPFSPRELMARVRVQLRRQAAGPGDEPVLVAGPLEVDPNAVEARLDARPLNLTPFEFRLLHALMLRAGRVLTRDALITAVHGDDDPGIIDRTIDVHLGRLRRKLRDDAAAPRFIATVRSVGYRFIGPVERRDPDGPAA